jgi:hypothetical protein
LAVAEVPSQSDRRLRRTAKIVIGLGIVAALAFLFLVPLPHDGGGSVTVPNLGGYAATVDLPSYTHVQLEWHSTSELPVEFELDPANRGGNVVCGPVVALNATCPFLTPLGGIHGILL